jgi:hypothetical protein
MKANAVLLAAAVVLMQHIMMMGAMSPNGALAIAVLPPAALDVN